MRLALEETCTCLTNYQNCKNFQVCLNSLRAINHAAKPVILKLGQKSFAVLVPGGGGE